MTLQSIQDRGREVAASKRKQLGLVRYTRAMVWQVILVCQLGFDKLGVCTSKQE